MFLKKVEFIEKTGENITWKIENLNLKNINLIVGKNGVGKTRTLILILDFVKLLYGSKLHRSGTFEWTGTFIFDDCGNTIKYYIKIKDDKVLEEKIINNKELLIRDKNGSCRIYSETEKKYSTFTPPDDRLAITVRRKEEEYPDIEKFFKWSENFHRFSFSGNQNRQTSISWAYEKVFESLDKMINILEEKFDDDIFKDIILEDLNSIGYEVNNIPSMTKFGSNTIVNIKEKGLIIDINQYTMSSGMYRVFSILIIFNYYLLMKKPYILIIDDLGEGLDFDRSSKLTKLLFDKVKDSQIQLIVTSNDRFLMNAVDLEYWNVLDRKGHIVTSYNYENSKDTFEGFSFTGLNNFDFFAMEFYKGDNND